MILRRLGNKNRLAKDIIKHFPPHKVYIESFFGAGGIYYNKPKTQYNFLNDLDDDVFNLFMVLKNQKQELIEYFEEVPFSESLFKYWIHHKETDAVPKAARFLYLSNFSYLGANTAIRLSLTKEFKMLIKNIYGFDDFSRPKFTNMDFRKLFKSITYIKKNNYESKTFIYNDPPYLTTGSNYLTDEWNEQDLIDLFEENMKMAERGAKFAISEFDNPFILEQAKKHNLEVITIGERKNLKNKRTEILVVNYKSPALYGLFKDINY